MNHFNSTGRWSLVIWLSVLAGARLAAADIVGGTEVEDGDAIRRSTVALYGPTRDGKGGSLCTASLIGPHTAVTAAHCIDSRPGAVPPAILFGRDVHDPGTQVRRVTATRVHPRWHGDASRGMDEGDIAVVHFDGAIPRGYGTTPVARSEASLRPGAVATLAGYGISDARNHAGSGILRKTQVPIASVRPGRSEMILDQSRGHGACHGDSGGPAFVREGGRAVLAGVTNRSYPGHAPDDCAHQVVYTKVAAYRPWIAGSAREMSAAARSAHASPRLKLRVARRHLTKRARRAIGAAPRAGIVIPGQKARQATHRSARAHRPVKARRTKQVNRVARSSRRGR